MAEAVHLPVLCKESIDALNIRDGGCYIDGTFGAGGYSLEIISTCTTRPSCSRLSMPVSYMSGCAAAARCYMRRTTDALRGSWRCGAAGACPTALTSLEYVSKRGCSSCTSTCTTRPSSSRISMPFSYMSLMCRCGAMLHDQDDRCAACQLAWRRFWDVADCSAIAGVPQ